MAKKATILEHPSDCIVVLWQPLTKPTHCGIDFCQHHSQFLSNFFRCAASKCFPSLILCSISVTCHVLICAEERLKECLQRQREDERVSVSNGLLFLVSACLSAQGAVNLSWCQSTCSSESVRGSSLMYARHYLCSISKTARMCLMTAVFAVPQEPWALWPIDKPNRLDLLLFVYFGTLLVSLVSVCLQRDMLFRVTCGTMSSAVSCSVCFGNMASVHQMKDHFDDLLFDNYVLYMGGLRWFVLN